MTPSRASFQKVYAYGLLVLWVSVGIILIPFSIIMGWPEILSSLAMALALQFMLTIFGLPVAAIASFIIGGAVWKIFKRIIPNDGFRTSLGGGVTGAVVVSLLLIEEFSKDLTQALLIVVALFCLGVWSGWAGERLARKQL